MYVKHNIKHIIGIIILLTVSMIIFVSIISPNADAFNFTINGTNITVVPAGGDCDLYAFSTTYHYNHDVTGRNADYPGYEYQYEGEMVDFWATVEDFSQNNLLNMNVFIEAQCPGGDYVTELERTSGPTFANGKYQAQFHGMWYIPDMITEIGNCELIFYAELPPGGDEPYCWDDLSNGMYTNVNDVLVNPQVAFTASSAFFFAPTVYNAFNPATPLWVDYQLQSDVDREGDGVIGDLMVHVPRLRGLNGNGVPIWTNNTGDIIPASNMRFHLNNNPPGVYTVLDDAGHPQYGTATIIEDISTHGMFGLSGSIRVFWELYYSQLFNAPGGYVSDPSWNGGTILFEYIIV